MSRTDVMIAPQRRKRGTKINTPPSVSVIAKPRVNGKAIQAGSRNSSMNRDHTSGSEIFHTPLEIKIRAIKKPATWLRMFFHGGASIDAVRGPAVVLASIYRH